MMGLRQARARMSRYLKFSTVIRSEASMSASVSMRDRPSVMRTRWGEKDLDIALQRQMLFTSREAKQIKKQVLARMLSGLAPGAAAK
jgi:hypothetical protein